MLPALAALVAAGSLTACGSPEPLPEVRQGERPAGVPSAGKPSAGKSSAGESSDGGVSDGGVSGGVAEVGGVVGGPGSACVLPVSFSAAAKWVPEAVRGGDDPEFAALTRQGPATVRCEVDAKPAGHLGYLRVWTAGKGSARAALEGFVKGEPGASKVVYKETRAGALPATEVLYTVFDKVREESKEERAFAVATPKGTVIVHLGGLDTDEHRAMLPAYALARTTLKPL
ncbi:lipoprotein [Streptomyces sp. Root66D1]|uniref:lipoprotein n=1 Tax=Streptomyces sp. Root66D1 TaxID=1736582 RepID=UPI001F5B9E1A|nr:lipoprotein [Streptomyces sp. Root66D1]